MKTKIVLLLGLAWACSKKEKPVVVQNDLPSMVVVTTAGNQVSMKSVSGRTVLVMFQPDCDHCQREAEQIRNHLPAFDGYQLYFISSAPLPEVEKFSLDYGFHTVSNAQFGVTTVNEVLNNFGPIDAPSVYIYDKSGKLKKSFNGETDIQLILQSL